ncbi:hypothetical protein cand_023850 [Cryptosporidium andersoni]|uniref:Uncharacterized protein n=1 Tax=Cryptosporidium andersoni TaxID=117008 RepID=A0A1J4MS30_9CRYT|nr:hypothetical protein cand_023850 [Cryptosporidium andersoni]
MVGTQRRCLMCLDESDIKAEQRYRRAINLEKANKALDVAKRAERLRLLYKVRFEEDLRAFMLVHKNATTKTDIAKKEKKGNTNNFDEKPKMIINKNFLIQSKNTDNGIPSWAWPASLRNTKKIKSNSLFYTLETKIPLSPTQQSGSNSLYKNIKITKENDRKSVEKLKEDTKQSSNEITKKKNKQKKNRDLVNIAKIAIHQSKINMGKHAPQRPTEKLTTNNNSLRSLHIKPFSWTKLKQYPDGIIQNSEKDVSATSKNLDMKDLPIPGQLEIQPASQLIKKSSNQFNYQMEYNSNLSIQPSISSVRPTELPQGTNKVLTDTLKRTQRMQQILQILMDQKNLDIERDEVASSISPSLLNENDEVEILAKSLTSKSQS